MINAQFTLLVVSIQASVVEKFVLGVDPVFFTMHSHTMTRLAFNLFSENMIFRKDLESPLIFVLFLRENKIRKKTLSVTLKRKRWFVKTKSGFEGQVIYWEGMTTSRSTPLSP